MGSWKNREDIIPILEQLLIASQDPNPALLKVRDEVWTNATYTQASTASIYNASKALSDAEVMRKIKETIDLERYAPNPLAATWVDDKGYELGNLDDAEAFSIRRNYPL